MTVICGLEDAVLVHLVHLSCPCVRIHGIPSDCVDHKLEYSSFIPNRCLCCICNKSSQDGQFRASAVHVITRAPPCQAKSAPFIHMIYSCLLPGRKKGDVQKPSLHEASSFSVGIGVFPKDFACIYDQNHAIWPPWLCGKLGRYVSFPAFLVEGRGDGRRDGVGPEWAILWHLSKCMTCSTLFKKKNHGFHLRVWPWLKRQMPARRFYSWWHLQTKR